MDQEAAQGQANAKATDNPACRQRPERLLIHQIGVPPTAGADFHACIHQQKNRCKPDQGLSERFPKGSALSGSLLLRGVFFNDRDTQEEHNAAELQQNQDGQHHIDPVPTPKQGENACRQQRAKDDAHPIEGMQIVEERRAPRKRTDKDIEACLNHASAQAHTYVGNLQQSERHFKNKAHHA